MKVAVLGLGSWGTAVAARLARAGHPVVGWTVDPGQPERLRADRENRKFLPGLSFPDLLQVTDRLTDALSGAGATVIAIPSHAVRPVAREARSALEGTLVVNLAKGIEEGTLLTMQAVLRQELGDGPSLVSLVGPSHAEEVALDQPTAVVAASAEADAARRCQELFADETFRVYTNDDVLGVELAVSLKNVIALAAGISAGLGHGDNTLGSLITRGLAEISRLGIRLGARPETFFGLAGVGDLVTTCASRHSRNRRAGEALGRGEPLDRVLETMGMVVEGVRTARAARELAERSGVEMPIVERVHAILFGGEDPREAMRRLMLRDLKAERPEGS